MSKVVFMYADSSGSNDKVQKQLEEKPHRIVRLEDTNGDGRFDKSIVFADRMMFPEGALWYDGSLYVSAPPSIWKLPTRMATASPISVKNGSKARRSPTVPTICTVHISVQTAGSIGARERSRSRRTRAKANHRW